MRLTTRRSTAAALWGLMAVGLASGVLSAQGHKKGNPEEKASTPW